MEKKSKRAIMIISLTLALVATGLSASYAWLVSTEEGGTVTGEMATVAVGILGETKVDTNDTLDFTITNDSNIDTYMRLGWTPIYRDADGKDLTTDTSGITIDVDLTDAPTGLIMASSAINSLNNYQKETIPLLCKEVVEGEVVYSYFRVHGEGNCGEIEGTINVTDGIDTDAIDRGETLHIILVPEAIQATKKAVKEARNWGWDEALVGNQACTIVGGGE